MRFRNSFKIQIVLLLLSIGISTYAADLNSDISDKILYDSEFQVKEKTIKLFGNREEKKNSRKSRNNKIEVQHIDEKSIEKENTLTDAEYIKSLKRADKKRIRNEHFELNVTRESTNEENAKTEAEGEIKSEDIMIDNPSDKKFFAKKKKQSNKRKKDEPANKSSISLTADETNYKPDTNEIEAKGNAKFEIAGQDFVLYGDKIIFSYDTSSLKAYGNVKIIKEENVTTGDFIYVDMTTACGWIQNPVTSNYSVSIKAKEAYISSDKIQENEGVIKILEDRRIEALGSGYSNVLNNLELEIGDSYMRKPEPTSLKFKVKEIIVTPKKEHNDIILKGVDVYYKKLKIATMPTMKMTSDKNGAATQTNIPEIGGDNILGMYFGPSYVASLPFSSTLRISPLLVYDTDDDKFGVGGYLKFMNETNTTELAYGTAKENFILKGKQKLTDNLQLLYNQNSYASEWFMGSRRPAYGVTLSYKDRYYIEDLDAHFEHMLTLGAYADTNRRSFSKSGEGRARWMGQITRDFFRYTNSDNTFSTFGGLGVQGMVSQYTTGDTFAIARIYPYITTTLGRWSQSLSYYQTGVGGRTPFMFDDYFYGKSSLQIVECLKINKYLSLGYAGTMALSGRESYYSGSTRNSDIDDLMQENKFLISIGPDEAKVTFSYDITRQTTSLYYSMLLGSKDMDIKFDKTIINNPMLMASEEKENKFLDKMRKLKYKVFPATNPDFDRERDLYPQLIPANGDEVSEEEEDLFQDEELKQELYNSPLNPLNQIQQQQNIMRDDRM